MQRLELHGRDLQARDVNGQEDVVLILEMELSESHPELAVAFFLLVDGFFADGLEKVLVFVEGPEDIGPKEVDSEQEDE